MKTEDLERLIHESLEQLGWKADAHQLARRVERLNYGLPLEDEFSVLCGWLGKCKLIHKLDQQQYPVSSSEIYQVPDLLAIFERNGTEIPVLIEVKSSSKNSLSFKPTYREKLRKYADLLNLPILVAWKNRWGVWALTDLNEFKKAEVNFNLRFEDALKNSLLGMLAGDFAYSLAVGAGVHISFRKEELVGTREENGSVTESWKMIVDDVYFSTSDGSVERELSSIAQQVFFSWDLEEEETHTDSHVVLHNTCKESSGLFAHMALTRVLNFHLLGEDDSLSWRRILGEDNAISTVSNFRHGIMENLEKKIVHHVIDQVPCNIPEFLDQI